MKADDTGRFDDATSSSPGRAAASARPARRGLVAAVGAALLTAGVVAVAAVASPGAGRDAAVPPVPSAVPSPAVELTTPAVAALPEGQNILCAESPSNPHCDRYVADLARRLPVRANRREEAERQRERIDSMMPPGREGPCEFDESSETCSTEIQPPTAGQVRRALAKAGYPAAVIRTARSDDPAPMGSLLLAVPAGTACVFLFHDGDDSQSWTAGQLPDGTCLAP